MYQEKEFLLTLADGTTVDVTLSIEDSMSADIDDVECEYNDAGLSEAQLEEVESLIQSNKKEWLRSFDNADDEEDDDWEQEY